MSFIGYSNDTTYKIVAVIFSAAFICLKIYVSTTSKWSFYNNLFEHLNRIIEQS